MQLLTKIYIKRIKLIHDYLCCYPKPDWLELNICLFFINGWRRERRNHVTITNGRSLSPNTDILNDVIQQDGRLHTAYNSYEVWPNVLLFYDILDVLVNFKNPFLLYKKITISLLKVAYKKINYYTKENTIDLLKCSNCHKQKIVTKEIDTRTN